MTQRSRSESPPHLRALYQQTWRDAGLWPANLADTESEASPHEDAVYWELFENVDRIDHCGVTFLGTAAQRRQLLAWAERDIEAPTPTIEARAAARALTLALTPHVTALGWERDATKEAGIGVFVALTRDAGQGSIALAGEAYGLTDALIEEAQAFTQAHAALRPISVGRFYGRRGGEGLRVIYHTGGDDDWWRKLRPADAAVLEQLYAVLPRESVTNIAVTFSAGPPRFAIEARASETLGIDVAWQRWADAAFPARTPLQARLLAHLHAEPTLQPSRWPLPIALEALRRGARALPHIDTVYSHVKILLDDDGALYRKLYLLSRVQWSESSAG